MAKNDEWGSIWYRLRVVLAWKLGQRHKYLKRELGIKKYRFHFSFRRIPREGVLKCQ